MSKSMTNIQSEGGKSGSPDPNVKSKLMDIHKKCSHTLNPKQKEEILGRYLTMTNKLSLTYFKSEIDGIKQEKEDTSLVLMDQKRQKIYDTEEIIVMNMQNNEFRKKIGAIEV